MSDIFISHSNEDNGVAREIADWLRHARQHESIFLDFDPRAGIKAGLEWEQELYRKVRASRAVVVLCSEHSMASRWCFMEIAYARALGKHLFPVKIADCEVDRVLTDRQVVDYTADRKEALERLADGLLEAGLDPADAFYYNPKRPPYPGLLAFQEEDAAIFFGRDDEIGEGLDLLNKVRRLGQTRLVMILGASGSGKSSLVRAGLVPRLRKDVERWLVVDAWRPRGDPAGALATVLARALGSEGRWTAIREDLRAAMDEFESEPAATATGAAAAQNDPSIDAGGLDSQPTVSERNPPAGLEQPPGEDAGRSDDPHAPFLAKMAELEAALPADADARAVRYLRLLRAAVTEREESSPRPQRVAAGGGLADPNPLIRLAEELKRRVRRDEARVLLVVDQFEELLVDAPEATAPTAGDDGAATGAAARPSRGATAFLRLLRDALDRPHSPLVVVGTMRSDFLGAFQECPALLDVRLESMSLGPLSRNDVAQVIEKPAAKARIEVEEGLVRRLLDDAEAENALPLLAFTLRELKERYGSDHELTIHDYADRLGGLQQAVARAADDILETEEVSREERSHLRVAFRSLVRVTEDRTFARSTAYRADLPPEALPLVDRFIAGRLLVAGKDERGVTVEVAHEALFRSWDTLVRWLDEDYEALRLRQEIERAARGWEEDDRQKEPLWGGLRLAQAMQLLDGNAGLHPDALGIEFVRASEKAEEEHRRNELRRTRRLLVTVSVGALVAVALGVFAFLQRNEAEQQTTRSYLQQGVMLVEQGEARRALALFAAAARRAPEDPVARAWVLDMLMRIGRPGPIAPFPPGRTAGFSPDGRWLAIGIGETPASPAWALFDAATGAELGRDRNDLGTLYSATFSRDGRRLLVHLGDRKTVELWDPWRQEELERRRVEKAWFGPNGRYAVLAAPNGEVHLWELPLGAAAVHESLLDTGGSRALDAAFSPEGRFLVVAGADGVARVFRAADGGQTAARRYHDPQTGTGPPTLTSRLGPSGLALAPGGRRLLVVTEEDGTRLWELSDGERNSPVIVPPEFPEYSYVVSAAFTPDGGTALVAFDSGRVELIDVRYGDDNLSLPVRANARKAVLAPDGRRLLTVTGDGARLWDSGSAEPVGPILWDFDMHGGGFSPDGRGLLTLSEAATRLSTLELGTRPGLALDHPSRVAALAFSPDGRRLLTATSGRPSRAAARVWDLTTAELVGEPFSIEAGDDRIVDVAFGPDGPRLLTVADDTLRIWGVDTGDLVELTVPSAGAAALSPDGRWLATVSVEDLSEAGESHARVWDATNGEPAMGPVAHGEGGLMVAFSGDGRRLVTASPDSARVWDRENGAAVGEPLVYDEEGQLQAVALSVDGGHLLVALRLPPQGGSAELWDVASGARKTLPHARAVLDVAFAADGRRLATASSEAQVWDARSGLTVGPSISHGPGMADTVLFDPTGRRLATMTSTGDAVRVWDVPTASSGAVPLLAELGEAVAGYALTAEGDLAPLEGRAKRLAALRRKAAGDAADPEIARLIAWYFDHPWSRAVSPYLPIGAPEFILRFPGAAMEALPGHPLTRRCVWPLAEITSPLPTDLETGCVREVIDLLVAMELLEAGAAEALVARSQGAGPDG